MVGTTQHKGSILPFLREHQILLGIVVFSFILRMLWLRTTIEGDEGYSMYAAWVWNKGRTPFSDILMNKGLLLSLFSRIPIYVFGNTIIPVRIANNVLFLCSIVVLYLIVKDWYGKRVGLISALFYGIFMNMPAFAAQQVMVESVSTPFVIFSIYFCNRFLRNKRRIMLLISGLMVSAAFFVMQSQAIVIILLLLMIAFSQYESVIERSETKLQFVKSFTAETSLLVVGAILPIILSVIYFWNVGILPEFLELYFLMFLPGGLHGSSSDVQFGIKFLTIAQGLPLWLFAFLGFIVCLFRRGRYFKYDAFSMIFVLLLLFAASIPPNFSHHYAVLIAPTSILASIALSFIPLSQITSQIENGQNVAKGAIFALLVISFIPPSFLAAQQYPDSNIDWEFISWYCSGDWSLKDYNEQLAVADFLSTNVPRNGQVLIWANWGTATIYWLSGHEFTSKYVTIRDPILRRIPTDEYQRIVKMVNDGDFDYVVLFWSSYAGLEGMRGKIDSIFDITLNKYSYVESIGGAHIFSKCNTQGEWISYSFIQEFSQATKEYDLPNGTRGDTETDFEKEPIFIPVIHSVSVNGEARRSIFQHPLYPLDSHIRNSYVSFNGITIPVQSKIKFGICVDPTVWNNGGDGVLFEIYIQDAQGSHKVFSNYISPAEKLDDRKWLDYEVNLAEYYEEVVNITFVTNPGSAGNAVYDWAHWSEPILVVQID